MYILNGKKDEIINSDFVERFRVIEHTDAALVIASYSRESQPVTIERYADKEEAKSALKEMFGALAAGQTYFDMPSSSYYSPATIRDARTKRKGGT